MKTCPKWVLWKHEKKDGRLTKVPYTVQGYKASVTNPNDRGSFDVAYGVYLRNPGVYSGLGYVLTEQDLYFIGDYDHVRDPVTGEFVPGIKEEILARILMLKFPKVVLVFIQLGRGSFQDQKGVMDVEKSTILKGFSQLQETISKTHHL